MFDIKKKLDEIQYIVYGGFQANEEKQEIIAEFEKLNQRNKNNKQILFKLSERLEKAEKALEDRDKTIKIL